MKIVVIGGKANSGKSTFGKYLKEHFKGYGYKPCIMHLTEPLYSYARNYFDWNGLERDKPREFLQKVGIEIIQEKMGKRDFLLNRTFEDIEVLSNFFDCFIITDARLVHEFEAFKERFDDVITIKVEREHYSSDLSEEEKKHRTEVELDSYKDFDYTVINHGLKDFNDSARDIVRLEENYEGAIL
jgi:dephospho-CoA kinase